MSSPRRRSSGSQPSSPWRENRKNVAIVGGGLVGLLSAIYFSKRHFAIDVYEKRKDARNDKLISDRSINLALSSRGIEALRKVGLAKDVLDNAIPMKGRMIHDKSGKTNIQSYGMFGQVVYSIGRQKLHDILLEMVDSLPNVNLHFENEAREIDLDSSKIVLHDKDLNQLSDIYPDMVVGTDGAYSSVRRAIMKKEKMNFHQEYSNHGYKELTIPPTSTGQFAIKPNYLHIWPRNDFMIIALPNQDKSFTCTCFFKYELFEKLSDSLMISEFFKKEFPDLLKVIGKDRLINDFKSNPLGPLLTIKCHPYNHKDKAIILGDAAHCMVPFYGQGLNCGFEDVKTLFRLIEKYEDDYELAFNTFSRIRHKDAVAICDLSLENYTEMSSSVLSPFYKIERSIVNGLHWLFPTKIIPLYTMVSFSQISYHNVVKKNRTQKLLIRLGMVAITAGSTLALSSILLKRGFGKACVSTCMSIVSKCWDKK
ncbi:kynurenine 3-monooxygenase [Rozella allomycis CSF55]|uniref:Kynurenine 3-monooxygenase n=1 Tax=Rozella allomycis (strain CSF55) TaxID=988480 RepID=A0A075APX3_ROZAC|nr:Monooxygenase, FAD-binding domain-containing protein [Rozella allomycis CSF55]RKP19551.1 kynurenine 3-monooxygenase [Rozella allomycis CSF55]|eukprot:EPZ30785.1 Monooxygenase, FAD-binding domain-containing protein [Rozella allomycis CSF55]